MNLSPFKQDIDDLINEFSEGESLQLAGMKKVWLSRKFSYIYEASPSINLAFFMQSLYGHTIGHMVCAASLSRRLGGLYCLYCLYETQPFKPPFRIYLSLGELKKLKDLVVEAKSKDIKVVVAVVKRMLEKNMFLFGSVEIIEGSVAETLNQLTELQNARVQIAYEKLFSDGKIDDFLHMDLSEEFDVAEMKKLSSEYAQAKRGAIEGAGKVVDVQNIKHISIDKQLMSHQLEKIAENWNVQRETFYQQTGLTQQPTLQAEQLQLIVRPDTEQMEQQDHDDFDELEQLLQS